MIKIACLDTVFERRFNFWYFCGNNDFQDYFDDAKESRVKQIPKIQELRFKNNQDQDSRLKIQESREDLIKISTKKVFQNIE